MVPRNRLTRADWVDAAYAVFEAEGLAAVRVETLAPRLHTTKGSFYWHFASRAELVRAVAERWEARDTDDVIAEALRPDGARERLAALFAVVARRPRGGEHRLYTQAATEGVADVVGRVTGRRTDFVAGLLVELGIPADEARRRAVLAVAIAVGLDQLDAGAGRQLATEPEGLIRSALAIVAAPPPPS